MSEVTLMQINCGNSTWKKTSKIIVLYCIVLYENHRQMEKHNLILMTYIEPLLI